jgi:TonB family protein
LSAYHVKVYLGVDLQGLGDSFEVGLRFSVSPEGKVESVERISSSGHPTVDIVAMRYLKGWQFAPLKAGADGGRQRGTIKLNLKLEKAAAK